MMLITIRLVAPVCGPIPMTEAHARIDLMTPTEIRLRETAAGRVVVEPVNTRILSRALLNFRLFGRILIAETGVKIVLPLPIEEVRRTTVAGPVARVFVSPRRL